MDALLFHAHSGGAASWPRSVGKKNNILPDRPLPIYKIYIQATFRLNS